MDACHIILKQHNNNLSTRVAAKIYECLGDAALQTSNLDKALFCLNEVYKLYCQIGDSLAIVQTQANIGQVLVALGQYSEANKILLQAIKDFRAMSRQLDIGLANYTLSKIARAQNNMSKEIEYLKTALRTARREGHPGLELLTLERLEQLGHPSSKYSGPGASRDVTLLRKALGFFNQEI